MTLSMVTVTGQFMDAAGNPQQGLVIFTPSNELYDLTGHLIVTTRPVTCTLTGGSFSSPPLVATDNGELTPSGWNYQVTIRLAGQPDQGLTCILPSSPSTVDITALVQVTAALPVTSFLTAQGGTLWGPLVLGGSPPLRIPTGAAPGDVLASDGSGNASWAPPAVPVPSSTEKTCYVSAASYASDSNDGLSIRTAKATIGAALTALGSSPGTINVGAGTFTISAADSSGNGVTLTQAGTVLAGAGMNLTKIILGANVTYGVVAKAAECSVSGFLLQAASGKTVTYGVGVATAGSAENCVFSGIRVQSGSGTVANGFAVSPDAHQDVAFTNFFNCTATSCTNAGWLLNDGTPSNVLDTRMFGCTSNGNIYGVYARATNFAWYGGDFGENTYSDLYIASIASGPIVADGFRSEASARLLYATAVGAAGVVAVRNAIWDSTPSFASADGDWINYSLGGSLILDNVQWLGSGSLTPVIIIGNVSTYTAVTANGLMTAAPLASLFSATPSQNVSITATGYVQISSTTQAATGRIPGPVVLSGTSAFQSYNGTVRDIAGPVETQTLASSGAVTINGTCRFAKITLQANATSSTVSNLYAGQQLAISWVQDATGGRAYSWPAVCKFAGGLTPTASTAANAIDTATFYYDGTNLIEIRALSPPANANDPNGFGVAMNFFPGVLPISQTASTNIGFFSKLTAGGFAISNLNVDVTASSGNISVAAYTSSGAGLSSAPTGGRLATSGAVPCPATGLAAISLGATVTPNLGDWVAISADNSTAAFLRPDATTGVGFLSIPGWGLFENSAHPLPSTPAGYAPSASSGFYLMRGS